jgi:nitrate/nitrite transport system permease protein
MLLADAAAQLAFAEKRFYWILIGLFLLYIGYLCLRIFVGKERPQDVMLNFLVYPCIGFASAILIWTLLSATIAKDLPSPYKTWQESKLYLVQPFTYRGELDQGMGLFAWLSLKLVLKGYILAILIGTPLGFLLGSSKIFTKIFDPLFQILRPVSPLAWFPLGLVVFTSAGKQTTEYASLFTIIMCAMWPTIINTALGVRAIPQDYLNVAKVLNLSPLQRLFKIQLPAALPYMFTGYRLSLGLAWLVIVAIEMLSGRPGVGGFLYQEYNSNVYSHIILCIIMIGVIGFALDRIMNLVEKHLNAILSFLAMIRRYIIRIVTLDWRKAPSPVS